MEKKKYSNFGEYIYWIYANLNMYNTALNLELKEYNKTCFMVRAKAFKAYKEGRWKIHSLFENNNWKVDWGKEHCWYCGGPVNECGKLTAEHIFPRSKGGNDSFDNIAYACKSCNSSKGDKDIILWMYDKQNLVPPFHLVCIYMKLVYKYAIEHELMLLHSKDLDQMNLPFNYNSLQCIEHIIKEEYLKSDTKS